MVIESCRPAVLHPPVSVKVWRCSRTTAAVSPGTAGSCTGPGCSLAMAERPQYGSIWGSSQIVPGSSSGRCSGYWRILSSRCWAQTHSGAHLWRWQTPGMPSSLGMWQDASLHLNQSAPETSWHTCWSEWPCFGCSCLEQRAGRSPGLWQWLTSSEPGLDQRKIQIRTKKPRLTQKESMWLHYAHTQTKL